MKNDRLRKLTTCAIMLSLSIVLGLFTLFKLPNGGSVTVASMVPIVFVAVKYDFKWAVLTSFALSLMQMLLGFYAPPTQTFGYFVLVILLDYIIAFTVLGFAGVIARRFKNETVGVAVAAFVVTTIRYICHIASGILIWGVYAPEGIPIWLYSLQYNGSYMIPEIIITTVVSVLLFKRIKIKA